MSNKDKLIQIRIDDVTERNLNNLSETQGVNKSQIIRNLINNQYGKLDARFVDEIPEIFNKVGHHNGTVIERHVLPYPINKTYLVVKFESVNELVTVEEQYFDYLGQL